MKKTNPSSSRVHIQNNEIWFTWPIEYVDHNRDTRYPVQPVAPCQSQSEPESMSESHLSVTFIAAWIVRWCQSALTIAMFIGAQIVRDLVRDHVRTALVSATHVKPTLVRAKLVRANVLSHMIYSLIHKMKDLQDLRFNLRASEREVELIISPTELNRARIRFSQPGLSDYIREHLPVPCVSELGLSETMSQTMSKLHLSGPPLSGQHLSGLKLPETKSECTFIAGIVRDYIRATLIRPQMLGTISEVNLSPYCSDEYKVVFALPISWENFRSSQAGCILLIHKSHHVMFGMCTLPLVDETCVECPLLSRQTWLSVYTVTIHCLIELTFKIASPECRVLLLGWYRSPALCIYWTKQFYTKKVAYILFKDMIALIYYIIVTYHYCMWSPTCQQLNQYWKFAA